MDKLKKIREILSQKGIDALLVIDELNQRYLSDFAFTDGLLLITQSRAELITDFRYFEMAQSKADKRFSISMPEKRSDLLNDIFITDSIKTVGFEGATLPYSQYLAYCQSFPKVEFVDIGTTIEEIRQIKTEEEIAKIQAAQDITDAAFSHILDIITPLMTEIEVAAEIEHFMKCHGAESAAFDTIVVSADASALPHGTPRNQKLRAGFLTLDYGAKLDGYCSDMTRTIVIGKASDEMKRLYNTVLTAQKLALDYLREGSDCGEADKIAREYIDSFDEYRGAFGHSLGHSLGLLVHETPSLSRRSNGRLMRVGEIYTVEPGIYLYGKYGCRIEDMVAIRESGIHNFTHSTKELIEIY